MTAETICAMATFAEHSMDKVGIRRGGLDYDSGTRCRLMQAMSC